MTSWMTVAEAVEQSGFHEVTIRDWCRAGRVAAKKIGGRWRLRSDWMERFGEEAEDEDQE